MMILTASFEGQERTITIRVGTLLDARGGAPRITNTMSTGIGNYTEEGFGYLEKAIGLNAAMIKKGARNTGPQDADGHRRRGRSSRSQCG
jgi:hypothetical protein